MFREITNEAQSLAKPSTDNDCDESEGCSSSEEDIEPPTSSKNAKKAIEVIEEDYSPSPRRGKESCENNEIQTPNGGSSVRNLHSTASVGPDEISLSKNMINLK